MYFRGYHREVIVNNEDILTNHLYSCPYEDISLDDRLDIDSDGTCQLYTVQLMLDICTPHSKQQLLFNT